MGQEESRMVDESTPPESLKARTVEAVASYINSGKVKRIVVMTGAGISTSAGIPDFRSPDTGLYANLQRLDLPFAEAVFDISFFRQNPLPFYTLAHELYPGKYRPTVAHSFVRLLQERGLLLKLFTQNIDCLEREAGVEDVKIVEAHGSFARQSCIDCHASASAEDMRAAVSERRVPHCTECGGLVKPDIVFFGEQLPEAFFNNRHLPAAADLCIVMGTSLSVQPFASLPAMARDGVPRILINKDQVGGLGCRADDVLMLGDCDDGVRGLADALGWRDELEALWAATAPKDAATIATEQEKAKKSRDELFQEQLEKLTADVDAALKLSTDHTERVKEGFRKEDEKVASYASAPEVVISGDKAAAQEAVDKPDQLTASETDDQKVASKSSQAAEAAKDEKTVNEGSRSDSTTSEPKLASGESEERAAPEHAPSQTESKPAL